jgi:hypothetical protein
VLVILADVGLLGVLESVGAVDANREVVGEPSRLLPVQAVVNDATLTVAIRTTRRITELRRPSVA